MSYAGKAQARSAEKDTRTEKELLKETLGSLLEADDTGTKVCITLDEQTEQIHRIRQDADEIHGNLERSKWLIKGMNRWGWFQNMFGGAPPPPSVVIRDGAGASGSGAISAPGTAPPARRGGSSAADAQRARAEAVGPKAKPLPGLPGTDPEVDALYDGLEGALANLKDKSHHIKATVEGQNRMLDDLSTGRRGITNLSGEVDKQRKDIKKISGR